MEWMDKAIDRAGEKIWMTLYGFLERIFEIVIEVGIIVSLVLMLWFAVQLMFTKDKNTNIGRLFFSGVSYIIVILIQKIYIE